jgi:hypothetical protein
MIARLRKTHAVVTSLVASLVTVAFFSAVTGATDKPAPDAMPAVLADRGIVAPTVEWERDDLWGAFPIVTRWRSDRGTQGELRLLDTRGPVIELDLAAPLGKPEVLLYWSPTLPTDPEALPGTSHLLGAVGGVGTRRFALPAPAEAGGGHLLLYSLGQAGVFATAALPAAPDGADR